MTLKIHSDYVYSLMFYKDTIISGSADKTMKLTKLTLDNNTFEVIESMNIEDEFSRIIQLNKEFSKFATIDFESTKIYTTTELMLKF